MTSNWSYVTASIVLKCPCGDDGETEKVAKKQIESIIKEISKFPSFIHIIVGPQRVSFEEFDKENGHKTCSLSDKGKGCGCE